MKVAITDANIFIDIIYLDFLEHLFSIDIEIYTTNTVLCELNLNQKSLLSKYILAGKLNV